MHGHRPSHQGSQVFQNGGEMKVIAMFVCAGGAFWSLIQGEAIPALILTTTAIILMMMPDNCKCSKHQ